ncbi:MAG: septal ring lytic transglycosylase RlpA family protein [Rubrivivax sp.]|nr:septal ring lytic transglycosylase RlpA family protein [Rubrivivax sp.]MDH5338416.1 septal ring lytic transglycosylase RlpA family protein [Rubrivivax sp.]
MSPQERTLVRRLPWLIAALLAACASGPRPGVDGPGANPPADLIALPDATPRVETLRRGGPNKPYEVLGQAYVPMTDDLPLRESGLASWYGRKFHGQPTSTGEIYDMYAMTAAHKTMPLPSYARVRNPANGRAVIVRVNDRGPFHPGRVIDLSYAAALKLDLLRSVAPVEVERLTNDEIRAGVWAAPGTEPVAASGLQGAPPEALLQAPLDAPAIAGAGFWLQLGAFRDRDGAQQLQRLVQGEAPWLAAQIATFDDGAWARVQAGPYASRGEAEAAAARLADALPLQAMVLRRP